MEPVEPRGRYNLRKALTIMERDIKRLEKAGTFILDPSVLKQYKVQVLPLSLEAGGSLAPKFFTSFAPEDMPESTEEYVERQYENGIITRSCHYGRLISNYLHCYVGGLVYDYPEAPRTWLQHQ